MTPSMASIDTALTAIPRGPVFSVTMLGKDRKVDLPRIDRQGQCLYTTSGRAAILLALRAFGVSHGAEVLVPSYHCPTMIEPAVRVGARPMFYPIGCDGKADMEFVRGVDTSRVKAMIAAHFFGLPIDLRDVRAFCDSRGVALIEDCAHAFFGSLHRNPVGTSGDAVIGSLVKFLPVTEGGCLILRAPDVQLPTLRRPRVGREIRVAWDILEAGARAGKLGTSGALLAALANLKDRLKGRSFEAPRISMSEAERGDACNTIDIDRAETAAASLVRWVASHADCGRIAEARRSNYLRFAALLSGHELIRPLFPDLPPGAVPYVFPLDVDAPELLYPSLRACGVPAYRWDIVWPGTPSLPSDAAKRWSTHVLQLACHQDMSEADVSAIARVIKRKSSAPRH